MVAGSGWKVNMAAAPRHMSSCQRVAFSWRRADPPHRLPVIARADRFAYRSRQTVFVTVPVASLPAQRPLFDDKAAHMTQALWTAVDDYLCHQLVTEDDALTQALHDSRAAGLPDIAVAPNQGKMLNLFARLMGA